jgi:hypothetical protein
VGKIEGWCGPNYLGGRESSVGELVRMSALCMSKLMIIWSRSITIGEDERGYFKNIK